MPKIGDTYRDHQQKTGQLMNQFKISCLFYSFAFVPSQVSGGKLDPNQISNFTILLPKKRDTYRDHQQKIGQLMNQLRLVVSNSTL